MTQRVFVALLTIGVFLAGYLARVWTEPRSSVPRPPEALAKEYTRDESGAANKKSADRQLDRAKLIAEIQKLRPHIDAYTTQIDEIGAEFDREFAHLLTPSQREKFAANQKKRAERDAKRLADRSPLSDEDIQRAKDRPLTSIYWNVVVTPHLEWMTKEYALDAAQQTNVRALLALKRNKFIALLDSTQHPSIRLSKLAPLIERMEPLPK
jgi:septal ring factor EnvC (AmiA/AmiB activator)